MQVSQRLNIHWLVHKKHRTEQNAKCCLIRILMSNYLNSETLEEVYANVLTSLGKMLSRPSIQMQPFFIFHLSAYSLYIRFPFLRCKCVNFSSFCSNEFRTEIVCILTFGPLRTCRKPHGIHHH